ncbi:MAG: HD domain-containing protein [Lachnospiraceae bacterium]|nr:HD domain-containing protein [Lachnospiraceae bacterium]
MDRFHEKLNTFLAHPDVQIMGEFPQHRKSNTLAHVTRVAKRSHGIAKKLHIKVDEDSMMRGAILHDYYLYSTHDMDMSAYRHVVSHAELALKNASAKFDLNKKEENIIYSHMWPLNVTHLPRCKEAWIISLADKICAIQEMLNFRLAVS